MSFHVKLTKTVGTPVSTIPICVLLCFFFVSFVFFVVHLVFCLPDLLSMDSPSRRVGSAGSQARPVPMSMGLGRAFRSTTCLLWSIGAWCVRPPNRDVPPAPCPSGSVDPFSGRRFRHARHHAMGFAQSLGLRITPARLRAFMSTRRGFSSRRCRTTWPCWKAGWPSSQSQSSSPSPCSGLTVK